MYIRNILHHLAFTPTALPHHDRQCSLPIGHQHNAKAPKGKEILNISPELTGGSMKEVTFEDEYGSFKNFI